MLFLRGVTMKTIDSSKLNWEIIPFEDGECRAIYCADGDGFVELVEYVYQNGEVWWSLTDQGEPVAMLEKISLEDALERAQSYLAATYNAIFKSFSF